MSEEKKSFREFLANDALNPGVKDENLQKVDVGSRKAEENNNYTSESRATKTTPSSIQKKPVALFAALWLVFLGLTIGLSFVSLWALFGIIPTLICFWKMVLNNADNNYKSVYSKFDGKYVDKEFEKIQKVEEIEPDIVKAEAKEKGADLTEQEKDEKDLNDKKDKKKPKSRKNIKSKDEDEIDECDDDNDEEEEEEEVEEKKSKKAEKSDKKFGSKVEKNDKRDVENYKSKTSLVERNKRTKGQRAMY